MGALAGDALHSRAHRRQRPEAFYRAWRLVAFDGTQFSVTNTPQLLGQLAKASSRRGKAAFAKITAAVLLGLWTSLLDPKAARRPNWSRSTANAGNRSFTFGN